MWQRKLFCYLIIWGYLISLLSCAPKADVNLKDREIVETVRQIGTVWADVLSKTTDKFSSRI